MWLPHVLVYDIKIRYRVVTYSHDVNEHLCVDENLLGLILAADKFNNRFIASAFDLIDKIAKTKIFVVVQRN